MRAARRLHFAAIAAIAAVTCFGCSTAEPTETDPDTEQQAVETPVEPATEAVPPEPAIDAERSDAEQSDDEAPAPPAETGARAELPPAIAALDLPDAAELADDVYVTTLATPADYAALAEAGFATIIDLHPIDRPTSHQYEEAARAAEVGYVLIPLDGPASLAEANADLFADVVRKEVRRGPILVQTADPAAAAALAAIRTALIEDSTEAGLAEGRRLGLTDPWVEPVRSAIEAARLPR